MAGAPKLGAQLAARLEESIRANAWGPDHYLGAEEQLSASFGASRAVVREAIAIAEWNGVVERRRGREGGVFVAPYAPGTAAGVLRNFLFLAGADLTQLLRARRLVEGRILDLAINRIGPADAEALTQLLPRAGQAEDADDRARLDQLKSIVERLAEVAGSPTLGLFGMASRHCYVDRVRTSTGEDAGYYEASRAVAALRLQQIEAIVAFDRPAARDLQTRAMDVWDTFDASLPAAGLTGARIVERLTDPQHDALIYEFVRPVKKAEALARALAQTIANRALGPGSHLGTEAALIAEFGVSRRVLREGLRILEHFGAVGSEKGMRGGLVVAAPQRGRLAGLLERAEAEVVHDEAALGLAPYLLAQAVRAIAALDPAGRARIVNAAGGADAIGVAGMIADVTPDVPAGCFLAMMLPLLRTGGTNAPAGEVQPLLEAIAAGDGYAAPRLAYRLFAEQAGAG